MCFLCPSVCCAVCTCASLISGNVSNGETFRKKLHRSTFVDNWLTSSAKFIPRNLYSNRMLSVSLSMYIRVLMGRNESRSPMSTESNRKVSNYGNIISRKRDKMHGCGGRKIGTEIAHRTTVTHSRSELSLSILYLSVLGHRAKKIEHSFLFTFEHE